jgi:hypothetical protein
LEIDHDETRRRYASLSDEALLEIDRDELVDAARQNYDEELIRRGLRYETKLYKFPEMDEPMAAVAVFVFAGEAYLARAFLQSSGVRCYLSHEYTLSVAWNWTNALGGLRLMVPVSELSQIQEALDGESAFVPVKEEVGADLDAYRRQRKGRVWTLVVLYFLFAHFDVSNLRLFYFF